jgi:Lon protease-like protein
MMGSAVHTTAILGMAWLMLPSSTAFICSLLPNSRNTHELGAGKTFTLPIFPLRKAVRLPTETLILNLYEERYLAMSEYILSQETKLFGTLYSSDKPQIVHGGQGPIVPMVDCGDIGVLCTVFEHEEGMVPTATEGFSRRRIRLQALGTSRYEIIKILHRGYDSDVPFILAEVEALDDLEEDIEDLKEQLERLDIPELLEHRRDILPTASQVEVTCSDAEYFSFSVASSLREGLTPQEIMSLLKMISTRDRLESILQVAQKKPWEFERLFGLK